MGAVQRGTDPASGSAEGLAVSRPTSVGAAGFRAVMAEFPTFVTVITVATVAGPAGCTANAVMALSLDPVSVLVSLASGGRTERHIDHCGRFAVNLLNWSQRTLAYQFAESDPRRRFDRVPYAEHAGVPILGGTAATLVCRLERSVPAWDHTLLIGLVEWTRLAPPTTALVHHRRRQHPLHSETESQS
ncbi:flavin reductase family protein [Micromonospora sp. FIMYZ51]|uniref:flavin reductase family protein n=1 Tax=Micromonospora sp. FIMYZ51 TaxID=3051832 RepID=UPI00311FF9F6